MREYHFYVYILTNDYGSVMYIGVTNNLLRRMTEHREGVNKGFTKKYHVHKLVYYEHYGDIRDAIHREKELKGWTRAKKNALVMSVNPTWREIELNP